MCLKICAAQLQPHTGAIELNIAQHLRMINAAASMGANVVFFPELSLTGYEPTLAKELAITSYDERLAVLQSAADNRQITIGAGAPTKAENGICISLILFQPGRENIMYSKQYLHPDEATFFVPGKPFKDILDCHRQRIALAICYELSVPTHTQEALADGADIFVVSVAKPGKGVETASATLSATAAKYRVPVMMVNAVGKCDTFESSGTSSVWNKMGELSGSLGDAETALLLYDTHTHSILKQAM